MTDAPGDVPPSVRALGLLPSIALSSRPTLFIVWLMT
jgi:hypothetical protein